MRAGKSATTITISGHVRHTGSPAAADTEPAEAANDLHLVCATRLDGYDTFLSGDLTLNNGQQINVRILTFDDLTVLLPRQHLDGWADGQAWNGTLRLRPAARKAEVPDDIAEAMHAAGLEESSYDPGELTHLLTWLDEAADADLRHQRLAVIVQSLAAHPTRPTGAPPHAAGAA
ncbi:hypothetical protein ACWEJ6_50920 [Nonomuraea sp. NPDC004702]